MNLFISNETEIELEHGTARVQIETKFPFEDTAVISVDNVPDGGITLAVRIPEYALDYKITHSGEDVEFGRNRGYAYIDVQEDASYTVSFKAPARFVRANPNVRADCGKLAMVKGPLVYCLEEADNGKNLSALYICADPEIREEKRELFGGIIGLTVQGKRMEESEWKENELYAAHPVKLKDVTLKAVPYAYWNNRGIGEMTVWVKELVGAVSDKQRE